MTVSLAALAALRAAGATRIALACVEPAALIREYLLLGLRFDRIEAGYVDAFTGDPALRQQRWRPSPPPTRPTWSVKPRRLIAALPDVPQRNGFDQQRADYVGAHLRALECAGRKFAGEDDRFRRRGACLLRRAHQQGRRRTTYRQAHARLDEVLGGTGPLADRMEAHRVGEEIPPERLAECIDAVLQRAARPGPRRLSAARHRDRRLPGGDRQAVVGIQLLPGRLPLDGRGQRRPQTADVQPAAAGRPRVLSRATTPSTAAKRPGWSTARAKPSRPSSWSTPRSA